MSEVLLGCLLLIAGTIPPSTLDQGDRAFERMDYPLAQAIYDSILGTTEDSANVLWRLARVNVCTGDISPDDQRLERYRKAEQFARRCTDADSRMPQGHTWRAAALGNIAMFEGGSTKVKLCSLIKRELDQSLMLDSTDDVAYSILGSFYRALGNVSWLERQFVAIFIGELPEGGFVEAESALKKAIAIAPGIIRHHYELAELYRDQDRFVEALGEFRLVGTLDEKLGIDKGLKQLAGIAVEVIADR